MSSEESITHIRPRFRFTVPFPTNEVMLRIEELLTDNKEKISGQIVQNHIMLDIPDDQRHYWSPQLNFRLEPDYEDQTHTVIKGLIGPRPAVWTMFMFIYFSIGAAGMVGFVYGMSQWIMGESSIWIYALPAAVLFMLTAYKAGKIGEQLGKDQIEILKDFVRKALDMK